MPELLARCSSEELTEWMAYEHVNGPIGGQRLDVLFAVLAATVSNTARGKGQRPKEPKDFLPKWDQGAAKEPADWRDMLAVAQQFTRRMNGPKHSVERKPR
ncbi:hypothetical protein [uncultured Streptomyces sp.]|uniref:phage tail assembly protein T n=1 Tax=uncultured Streptomyces sp. TaxID=174707 RepID=UPI0026023068|nr:hypothetical protein [uncultured Streptomyces sp.]